MDKDRLLEILKNEPNDRDAIGMILSNYTDFATSDGGMVSVKQFRVVAGVLIEWWEGKKQTTSEQLEHEALLGVVLPDDIQAHNAVMKLRKELKDKGKDESLADINGWIMGVNWCKDFITGKITHNDLENKGRFLSCISDEDYY